MVSMVRIIYTANRGSTIGPYTDIGKVWTQMKLATGAASIPVTSQIGFGDD
jgi:hypothetical protein